MRTAIVVFDGLTALDAVGPYEVLSRIPGNEVLLVAAEAGPVRTETGMLTLIAEAALADVPHPDVVVVAGGPGQKALMDHPPVLDWLRAASSTATWTASVCTGSLLLAAAGLLRGRRATTHWLALDQLPAYGVTPVRARYVVDGQFATAAGVSAGLDLALHLVGLLAGDHLAQAVQLGIEYDPAPPYAAGSPDTAPVAVREALCNHRAAILG